MNKWFFVQDILPILGCFWCFGCYFSWKPFFWPNVLYMFRKLLMWGLIWCIEHSISIISQRLWIPVTRWDNFDSYTQTLIIINKNSQNSIISLFPVGPFIQTMYDRVWKAKMCHISHRRATSTIHKKPPLKLVMFLSTGRDLTEKQVSTRYFMFSDRLGWWPLRWYRNHLLPKMFLFPAHRVHLPLFPAGGDKTSDVLRGSIC